MADNDDVPLGPAGRDYYARRFGARLQDIRKYAPAPAVGGPAPRASSSPGCGRAIGGVAVFGIIAVVRLVIGFGGSSTSSSSSYSPSYSTPSGYYKDDDRVREDLDRIQKDRDAETQRRRQAEVDRILHPPGDPGADDAKPDQFRPDPDPVPRRDGPAAGGPGVDPDR